MKTLALLAALMMCVPAFGQQYRMPIKFDCNCTDSVGLIYATAFRDILAKSPRYIETALDSKKDGNGKISQYYFVIHALSMDAGENNSGISSAISVTITIDDIYMDQYIQICGANKTAVCAEQLMSHMDSTITTLTNKR